MIVACVFFMLLYKAWDVVSGKRESVIDDSFAEKERKKLINSSYCK